MIRWNPRWISAAAHAYTAVRLAPSLEAPWQQGLVFAILGLGAWLTPKLIDAPVYRDGRPDPGVVAASLWAGFFSSLFGLTVIRDALWSGLFVGQLVLPTINYLNLFPYVSAWLVIGLALFLTGVGYRQARRPPRVALIEIPIKDLPSEFEGFSVAQISDLHIGPTIRRRMVERLVRQVNELDADVVAITGDLVDGKVSDLAHHVEPLAELKGKAGVFVVTGNHEYYAGAAPWVAHFKMLGLHVLLNEHVVLLSGRHTQQGRSHLVLAGVTDFEAGHFIPLHASDPMKALSNAPADACVRLLLAHQPRSAQASEEAGFDLQISGHTHGGQFWPWNLFVPLQQPFVSGLHRVGSMWVYVSKGCGYWGPPKRLGCASEISLIKLYRQI